MEKVVWPEKEKVVQKPVPTQFNREALFIIAKICLLMSGYKNTEKVYKKNGMTEIKIKPYPLRERLLYSSSSHAIRTSLEGYDYANKTI